MTFFSFMIRNHKDTKTEADQLANKMRMDRDRFPRNSRKLDAWGELLHEYIKRHPEIYEGFMMTFEECWKEYVKCEKSKSRRNSSKP